MAEPFLAEIRVFSFQFPPKGWALCNGQLLPINQNQALFSLLGTTYGGDGRVNFALPDLRGRVPLHESPDFALGQKAGERTVTLGIAQLPPHTHAPRGTSEAATVTSPAGASLAAPRGRRPVIPYGAANALTPLTSAAVGNAGSGQGHTNLQPFLTLNFCIALQGIFPSPN
jgi:microcystin-dependent protein